MEHTAELRESLEGFILFMNECEGLGEEASKLSNTNVDGEEQWNSFMNLADEANNRSNTNADRGHSNVPPPMERPAIPTMTPNTNAEDPPRVEPPGKELSGIAAVEFLRTKEGQQCTIPGGWHVAGEKMVVCGHQPKGKARGHKDKTEKARIVLLVDGRELYLWKCHGTKNVLHAPKVELYKEGGGATCQIGKTLDVTGEKGPAPKASKKRDRAAEEHEDVAVQSIQKRQETLFDYAALSDSPTIAFLAKLFNYFVPAALWFVYVLVPDRKCIIIKMDQGTLVEMIDGKQQHVFVLHDKEVRWCALDAHPKGSFFTDPYLAVAEANEHATMMGHELPSEDLLRWFDGMMRSCSSNKEVKSPVDIFSDLARNQRILFLPVAEPAVERIADDRVDSLCDE